MKNFAKFMMAVATACSILSMTACSENEAENVYVTGVHKIVIELSGNENAHYTASFAGSVSTGTAKLYNETGEYMGGTYQEKGVLEGGKIITCYTEDNTYILVSALGLVCENANENVTYSIKAYINDELVDQLSGTFQSKEGSINKEISLSTGVKK